MIDDSLRHQFSKNIRKVDRFKMIAAPFLILIDSRRVLLMRRYNTGYADGLYSLPVGHVEDDETLIETLIRETKEEIGISLDPQHITLVHVMHLKQNDIRMHFFFTLSRWKGTPKICEPDKCDDLGWFPQDNLPPNAIPYILSALSMYKTKQLYSEFGWK